MNWQAHYDAIYASLGVQATLSIGTEEISLTVIDKTAGVQVSDWSAKSIDVITIRPACAVRVYELTGQGASLEDLYGATIEFNGSAWRIENRMMKPSPAGQGDGEVYLILIEDNGT